MATATGYNLTRTSKISWSVTEYVEGPEAWQRFSGMMKKVIQVPYAELQRRVEAEKEKAAMNPRKRGSKPGVLNHAPKAAKPRRAS